MIRLITFLIIIFIAFGCNDKAKTKSTEQVKTDTIAPFAVVTDSPKQMIDTVNNKIEEAVADKPAHDYWKTIDFEKYGVEVATNSTKAPLDWADYPEAKDFKTRIIEAYKRDEIDFAGHYILATFGCGASCIMGFMVDVRNGKIYDLPLGEENSCLFAEDRVVCKSTSRLFIAGICKQNIEDKNVYYKSYLWDEDQKEFKIIEAKEFLRD